MHRWQRIEISERERDFWNGAFWSAFLIRASAHSFMAGRHISRSKVSIWQPRASTKVPLKTRPVHFKTFPDKRTNFEFFFRVAMCLTLRITTENCNYRENFCGTSTNESQLSNLQWIPNSVSIAFGTAVKWAHQKDSNDAPRPTEFQISYPFLRTT